MNEQKVGEYWNDNAPVWTALARAGHDVYRDHLNSPAFFDTLPEVKGLKGLDIGCGEGYNTRLLAERGAMVEGIDIAPAFIDSARASEEASPLGIPYAVASATELPYPNASFDFATSFMCLMDLPDAGKAFREAYRVLKPGGFFQFSIEHPCFKTPHLRKLMNAEGLRYAVEVGGYFNGAQGEISEWIFGDAPPEIKQHNVFKVPTYHRTLSFWMNAITASGFVIEHVEEPYPSDEKVKEIPRLQAAQVVAQFLQVRCRK